MSNLGASIITFTPSTTIKSADVNSNFAALNNAASPTFTTVTVTGSSSLDGGKITTDGAGGLTTTGFLRTLPAAVPASTTSYLTVQVSGNTSGRASLGINANGSGNLLLGNNGTSYGVELTTDGVTLLIGGAKAVLTGPHSAGQLIASYGTGVPLALAANEVYFQLA